MRVMHSIFVRVKNQMGFRSARKVKGFKVRAKKT